MSRDDARSSRRAFVEELTLMGYTPEKIAARLGVNVNTVKRDLEAIRTNWQRNNQKSYREYIEEELEDLKMLKRALEDGINMGSWKHIETALKLAERRADLMGLNHADRMNQARVEIEKAQLELLARALEKALDMVELGPDEREIIVGTLINELEASPLEMEEE